MAKWGDFNIEATNTLPPLQRAQALKEKIGTLQEELDRLNREYATDAVFTVYVDYYGNYAAVTRPGSTVFGLPGGKVELGESLVDAVVRESEEEGWIVTGVDEKPFYSMQVHGLNCHWFRVKDAQQIAGNFKDKGRILNLWVRRHSLCIDASLGNSEALEAYDRYLDALEAIRKSSGHDAI